MAINVNNFGANSKQIIISNETSIDNILTAVDNAFIALGWTLFDTVTTGANNAQVTKVYRALNADGVTYKYMGIYWWPTRGLFHTTCWESWNNVTHVGTNEVFTAGRTFPQGVQYNNCSIYVMASANWALMLSTIRGEPGLWSGVIEFEREAPEDTAANGLPCFAWTNSCIIGEPVTYNNSISTQNADNWVVSFPRVHPNKVGFEAANATSLLTSFGMYPPPIPDTITLGANSHGLKLGGAMGSYVLDPSKKPVHSLKGVGSTTSFPRGRIFGLKAIPNIGNVFETVSIKVDANKFHAAAGTPLDHLILPISGGWVGSANVQYGASRFVGSTYGGSVGQGAAAGVLVKGQYIYWSGVTSGLYKTDLDTGVTSQVVAAGTELITDIAYDGGSYLYCAMATGMARIAIVDDSVTTLAGGQPGYLALEIDEQYIYASYRVNGTTQKVDIIGRATFTVLRTYTFTIGNTNNALSALAVDFAGNCYLGTGSIQQSAGTSDNRVHKLVGDTGVGTYGVASTYTAGTIWCRCLGLHFDGTTIWWIANTNQAANIYLTVGLSTALVVTHPQQNVTTLASAAGMISTGLPLPIDRVAKLMPIKGMVLAAKAFSAANADPTLVAFNIKCSELTDGKAMNTVASGAPQQSYPINPNGATNAYQVKNFGSFYLTCTLLTSAPVCMTSGMFKTTNHAGLPTAHLLIPA